MKLSFAIKLLVAFFVAGIAPAAILQTTGYRGTAPTIVVPPQDRNPAPVTRHPTPLADPIATTLILPDQRQQDIDFAHAIAVGDELATTYPTAHVWRVTRIRFELFETYTARLLYVEDLR